MEVDEPDEVDVTTEGVGYAAKVGAVTSGRSTVSCSLTTGWVKKKVTLEGWKLWGLNLF